MPSEVQHLFHIITTNIMAFSQQSDFDEAFGVFQDQTIDPRCLNYGSAGPLLDNYDHLFKDILDHPGAEAQNPTESFPSSPGPICSTTTDNHSLRGDEQSARSLWHCDILGKPAAAQYTIGMRCSSYPQTTTPTMSRINPERSFNFPEFLESAAAASLRELQQNMPANVASAMLTACAHILHTQIDCPCLFEDLQKLEGLQLKVRERASDAVPGTSHRSLIQRAHYTFELLKCFVQFHDEPVERLAESLKQIPQAIRATACISRSLKARSVDDCEAAIGPWAWKQVVIPLLNQNNKHDLIVWAENHLCDNKDESPSVSKSPEQSIDSDCVITHIIPVPTPAPSRQGKVRPLNTIF